MYKNIQAFVIKGALVLISIFLLKCASTPDVTDNESNISRWPHAVSYAVFVQSFYDSNGDGVGDLKGLTSKIDYFKELGVEVIRLLPVHPSPSYHKYDIVDFYDIDPDYGNIEDFKTFVETAHQNGIKVMMDLVVNHTSNQHPWFTQAKSDKGSYFRDFYIWSTLEAIEADEQAKAAFGETEYRKLWQPIKGDNEYYFELFPMGMPDLNYESPKVRKEVINIAKFWLQEIGVDGFRLDAAKHIYPISHEKNYEWWNEFRKELEKVNPEVLLVGEVWDETLVVAPYLASIHSVFNFDLGLEIIKAVKEENGIRIADRLVDIRDMYASFNQNYVDGIFTTNHDQERLMSQLNGNMDHARMAAALLLTFPGAPHIYYGEELGMIGKAPDHNFRSSFLWDEADFDKGQTRWIAHPYIKGQALPQPLKIQKKDKKSLFHHYKKLIHLRNKSYGLTYGDFVPANFGNESLCAFYRIHEKENLLVLHNLSGETVDVSISDVIRQFTDLYFCTCTEESWVFSADSLVLPPYTTLILAKRGE
jgi:alpha-amylase